MTLGSAKSEDPRLSAVKLFSKYFNLRNHNGGAEIASTGKCKYGKVKYKVAKCAQVENTSTENSSTAVQGWKMQVRKIQVQLRKDGKCKYGKIKYSCARMENAVIEYGITVQLQSYFSLLTN